MDDRAAARSLPGRLGQLERCGRSAAPLFTRVPHSGLVPIEAALDDAAELKSVVLLGFTADGAHLVSYTTQPVAAADGREGYCLQLWTFAPGTRCRRLWSVPLFRVPSYLEALADEEGFLAADDMLLTIAEAPDAGLLVVHGRASDGGAGREPLPSYLTLLPGPAHAGAAQLQAAHLCYHAAFPYAPFNPYHALTPLGGGRLAIALYTGDGVRWVHAAAHRTPLQAPSPAPSQQQRQAPPHSPASGMASALEEGEEESSSSHFRAPSLPPAGQRGGVQPPPAASMEAESPRRPASSQGTPQGTPARSSWPPAEHARATSPAGSPWPRARRRQPPRPLPSPSDDAEAVLSLAYATVNCAHAWGGGGHLAAAWAAAAAAAAASGGGSGRGLAAAAAAVSVATAPQRLDLEACLYEALQQRGLPPGVLLDYAAAPVAGASWAGADGLLLLAVLRLSQLDAEPATAQPEGGSQGGPPRTSARSACVLLHAAAGDGRPAVVEWLEPPYPWHDDLSAFLVQQTAFAGLAFDKAPAFFADFMRSRWGAPPPRAWRLPLVLTNRSVLGTGQSLDHIAHPWLPQALLGYGCGGGGGGV